MSEMSNEQLNWIFFTGLALVWALVWAGIPLMIGAEDQFAEEVSYIERPLTTVFEPGSEIRVEGRVASKDLITSPVEDKRGVVSRTEVRYLSAYNDSQGERVYESWNIGPMYRGADPIAFAVGDRVLELPVERWVDGYQSGRGTRGQVSEIPDGVHIDGARLEEAKRDAKGSFHAYEISEWVLVPDEPVFLVATLDSEGLLAPDPTFERVVVYHGSRDEMVAFLRGQETGMWVLKAIFICLGLAPLGLLLLVRLNWRKEEVADTPN